MVRQVWKFSSSCFRVSSSTSPRAPEKRLGRAGSFHGLSGAQMLCQIGPQLRRVLLGGPQIQLVPAGLHGQVQILHRFPVVCVLPHRKSARLNTDRVPTIGAGLDPADTGLVQGQGAVGTQQGDGAHKNPPDKDAQTRPLLK